MQSTRGSDRVFAVTRALTAQGVGSISGAELARQSNVSAQTVTNLRPELTAEVPGLLAVGQQRLLAAARRWASEGTATRAGVERHLTADMRAELESILGDRLNGQGRSRPPRR